MALSGCLTNLLLGFIGMAAFFAVIPLNNSILLTILQYIYLYNVMFAVFNLLPIPPLDGSQVLGVCLSPSARQKYEAFSRYGMILLLDLLLYLISKNKINISDIPIAQITGQYLLYIHRWQELDMDIASEFILMASRLLEIKSRTLLPRQPEEVDEEDLRETLVSQLIDYQVFKRIIG